MGTVSYYTAEGLQKLKDELAELKTKGRAEVARQLADEVYTTDYIGYVLGRVKQMVEHQLSTNPPALIAKALQEAFWLKDFKETAQLAAGIVAGTANSKSIKFQ